jgi:hypothetical protein
MTSMQRTKKQISYPRKKILEVIRTVNELVVSLDQIGSAHTNATEQEHNFAVDDFMIRHDIYRKLAHARTILHDAFSRKLGPDGMDELEREMQAVRYWNDSSKKRTARSGRSKNTGA